VCVSGLHVNEGQVCAVGYLDDNGKHHVGEEFTCEFLKACKQYSEDKAKKAEKSPKKRSGNNDDDGSRRKRRKLTSSTSASVAPSVSVSSNTEAMSTSSSHFSIPPTSSSGVMDREPSTVGEVSPLTNVVTSADYQPLTQDAAPFTPFDPNTSTVFEDFVEVPAFWERRDSLFFSPDDSLDYPFSECEEFY